MQIIEILDNWLQIIEGLPNATAIQLDVMDHENLHKYISQVEFLFWNLY